MGLSSTIDANKYKKIDTSVVLDFRRIMRNIISIELSDKYLRLDRLIERYIELVQKTEKGNFDINSDSDWEEKLEGELKSQIRNLKALEREFISNEKEIMSTPYEDLSNKRNGLMNKNANIYTQRINIQGKITQLSHLINKKLYNMNTNNSNLSASMSEMQDLVQDVSETLDEIAKLSLNGTRIETTSLPEARNKEIFDIIHEIYQGESIEDLRTKYQSVMLFVNTFVELRKMEFKLIKKTSEEIEAKYKDRELMSYDDTSFHILKNIKVLISPLLMSEDIEAVISFDKNGKTVEDNKIISTAFIIMGELIYSKLNGNYTIENAKIASAKLRALKPTNYKIECLINNTILNIERLEINENAKKGGIK